MHCWHRIRKPFRMCGIVGAFWREPPSDAQARLASGIAALRHRGPDDTGCQAAAVAGGELLLGHARLSIIDLSSGGHQPMRSADARYTIVYNGEIYNYRELREQLVLLGHAFRTDSDTEVLLACWVQWGHECLRRLQGMFAFVVFDAVEQSLSCVRDPFGIKPFFYTHDQSGFRFASELPALLTLLTARPGVNEQRAYDYLTWGVYDDQASTFYKGVWHLLPGHFLVVNLRDHAIAKPIRWWWPDISEQPEFGFAEATEELRERFLQNVRLHLRSDVPLGATLSGGIDSSAVVCAMRRLQPEMPIHTFSFVAPNADVDEERWVDLVNSHVGAIVHKVAVSPAELAADIDDMIRVQGEPFGSTSIYAQYRVFRLAKEQGITVTLDGQGADELLAGYHGFPSARMQSCVERAEMTSLLKLMRGWSRYPGRSRAAAIRAALGGATRTNILPDRLRTAMHRWRRWRPPAWLDTAVLRERQVSLSPPLALPPPEGKGRRLAQALREALSGRGLSGLLRHGDRNSMGWSIEARVPFLTVELAEFVLRLPESYLLSPDGETKHIFRAAMRGIVPDAILDRRDKIGFQTPESSWLQALGPKLLLWLNEAENIPFLNAARCREQVQMLCKTSVYPTAKLWRLINFCRWHELQNGC